MPTEELRYVEYAREFGWTPDQVDALPVHLDLWLLPISNMLKVVNVRKGLPIDT